MSDIVKHLRENVMDAASRMIRSHFGTEGPRPEIQIPARPDQDTDCVLVGGIKDAADEIERLREQSQWRDIESAPKKQGTEVLVFVPEIGEPILARYIALIDFLTEAEILKEINEHNATDDYLEEPDWFYADFCHGARLTEGHPTHWMPLPPPPETTE